MFLSDPLNLPVYSNPHLTDYNWREDHQDKKELTRDSGWCGKIRVPNSEEASLDISRQPPIPHLSRIKYRVYLVIIKIFVVKN